MPAWMYEDWEMTEEEAAALDAFLANPSRPKLTNRPRMIEVVEPEFFLKGEKMEKRAIVDENTPVEDPKQPLTKEAGKVDVDKLDAEHTTRRLQKLPEEKK